MDKLRKKHELLEVFSQNLNLVLDAAGYPPLNKGRQAAVAQDFKMSAAGAGKWLEGKSLPEPDTLLAISRRYNVSIDELYGNGARPSGKTIAIPLRNSLEEKNKSDSVVNFEAEYLKNGLRVNQAGVHLLVCRGDSMSPTINDGDTMFVDTPVTSLDDNAVYLLRYQSRILVRRIRMGIDNNARLICDNTQYEAATYPLDKIIYNKSNAISLEPNDSPSSDKVGLVILGKIPWSIKRIMGLPVSGQFSTN